MYATMAGKTDAPPSVGREFVTASHGMRKLPEHANRKKKTALARAKQRLQEKE